MTETVLTVLRRCLGRVTVTREMREGQSSGKQGAQKWDTVHWPRAKALQAATSFALYL